ncbi:MAG: hypothetical protein LBM07_07545 [Culturomica sp.]|jgi:hypothetical protein|nr:hypothetical protein [Culturomica sp.]
MEKHNTTPEGIELRSEKIRNIIGRIPPALVWWGITVIAVIFVAFFLILFCLHYPDGEGKTIFQHFF